MRKKVRAKIQFFNKTIFLCFKFFSSKIIFPLLNGPFNNNIAFFERKMIYFCLRSNFREFTTLIDKITKHYFLDMSILKEIIEKSKIHNLDLKIILVFRISLSISDET